MAKLIFIFLMLLSLSVVASLAEAQAEKSASAQEQFRRVSQDPVILSFVAELEKKYEKKVKCELPASSEKVHWFCLNNQFCNYNFVIPCIQIDKTTKLQITIWGTDNAVFNEIKSLKLEYFRNSNQKR